MQRRDLAATLFAPATAAAILSENAKAQTCTAPCYAQTPAELAAGITPSNYAYSPSPVYNMARYGISPNGADNTTIVKAVFNMIKVTGGTMEFPYGDWAFYLDISGATKPVCIEGNGSTFRCYSASPTQSCVIFANNTGGTVTSAGSPITASGYGGAAIQLRNCNILAQLYTGGSVTGDLNCAVAIYGTAVKTWNASFSYGKIASFFGYYCQYTEFWSSAFYLSSLSSTSAGCILTGYTNNSGSNEVEFIRCVFQSNAVALHIKGAFKTRLYGCNMQGNGTAYPFGSGTAAAGVLILNADASGFGCVNPTIEGVWFPDNYAPDIYEATETTSPRFLNCCFYGGGSGTRYITSSFCSDWVIENCQVYGVSLVCTLNWPSADPGAVKLKFRGNNFPPVFAFVHAGGGYDIDIHYVGSFSGTLTGCSGSPNVTIWYAYEGTCIDFETTHAHGYKQFRRMHIDGSARRAYPFDNTIWLLPSRKRWRGRSKRLQHQRDSNHLLFQRLRYRICSFWYEGGSRWCLSLSTIHLNPHATKHSTSLLPANPWSREAAESCPARISNRPACRHELL